MTPLERAHRFFEKDAFAMQVVGCRIDAVETGYTRCSLALTAQHQNAGGGIMGGVLFTLCDFCFAVAANLDHPTVVTLSSQMTFLNPPTGTRIIAEARCVKDGYHTCFYEVTLTDENKTTVAMAGISGFVKR